MTDTIPVHVYGRVSYIDNKTHPNRKEDKSLVIQQQAFKDACETIIPDLFGGRKGNIVGTYSDEGKSASRKRVKRKDYNRLLGDIEQGIVKVLVVLNLSRIARLHHKDAMRLHLMLDDRRVQLVSIDDRKIISIDELMGFIEVAFKSNNDHEAARTVGKNTLRGCLHSISQGNAHCNYIPFGMKKIFTTERGDIITVNRGEKISKGEEWKVSLIPGDETEQEIVKWIFKTYITRDISQAYIARELNQHENPLWRTGPKGNGWREESVGWILQNKHYNGKVFYGDHPNGEFYRTNVANIADAKVVSKPAPLVKQSEHKPLIDDVTFNAVQKKIERNKLTRHKPQTTKSNPEGNCLTGVLICKKCGRALQAFNKKNIRYQCKARHSCPYWSVSESEMLPFIMAKIDNELLKQLQDKPTVPTNSANQQTSKVSEIDQRIKALETAMKTSAIETIPSLVKSIDDLNQQRNALLAERGEENYHTRLLAAYDRWEMMVQPYLVSIKTGSVGEGNEAVKHLGIRDEIDRLFNFTAARPSAIRQLLHDLECRVELSFRPVHPNADGSGIRGGKWAVDMGEIVCQIEASRTTISRSSK